MAQQSSAGAAHRYPPLITFGVALFLVLAVLPSALNLPQSNPGTTLEYAPVPPSDDEPPTNAGNLSTLSLAKTSAIADAQPAPAAVNPVVGRSPTQKRCVGRPPRQTADPTSPPCVAYFEGDNFGNTHRGVTKDEIRILFYVQGGYLRRTDRGEEFDGPEGIYDLAKPPQATETAIPRMLRRFQRYFNDRYQTYGRFAHFYVHQNDGDDPRNTQSLRAKAAEGWKEVQPFAVLTSGMAVFNQQVYMDDMARRGALVFGSGISRPNSYFRRSAPRVWSFVPSIETKAELYATYVCRNIAGRPVGDSGMPGENGKQRKFGLLSSADPNQPELVTFASLVRKQVEACGVRFVHAATFPVSGWQFQWRQSDATASYAAANMAGFAQKGVNTILWAGGYETDQTKAAANLNYRPEWIVAGDELHEGRTNSTWQEQSVWQYARVVSNITKTLPPEESHCQSAVREADPDAGSADRTLACAGTYYRDLMQLFTGIQVAGPRLEPSSVDRGFHAIPDVPSTDPTIAACFYLPGDYTCVKDATLMYWDNNGSTGSGAGNGCWRMLDGGARYLARTWPRKDVEASDRSPSLPCNLYNRTAQSF